LKFFINVLQRVYDFLGRYILVEGSHHVQTSRPMETMQTLMSTTGSRFDGQKQMWWQIAKTHPPDPSDPRLFSNNPPRPPNPQGVEQPSPPLWNPRPPQSRRTGAASLSGRPFRVAGPPHCRVPPHGRTSTASPGR
jgi:hypothetical protein